MSHLAPFVDPPAANPDWPAVDAPVLAEVARLLEIGRPPDAFTRALGGPSVWLRNARGVCLLRLGRPREAVELLRPLAFDTAGIAIRSDAPPEFLANYATALLLDGNAEGFYGVLADIRERSHPAVARILTAIRRWRSGLTWWQRAAVFFGGGPRFVLDIPPGYL